MKILTIALVFLSLLAGLSRADVVRPAPNFEIPTIGSNATLRKNLDDHPVVMLFAESPRSGAFKKQVKLLEKNYRFFAGRDTVFIAVFTQQPDRPVKSDIPFVIVPDTGNIPASYGIEPGDFGIAVVGPDGNLDLITEEVVSGEWVLTVIDNTFVVQEEGR